MMIMNKTDEYSKKSTKNSQLLANYSPIIHRPRHLTLQSCKYGHVFPLVSASVQYVLSKQKK